ncbi:hypothetical protein SRB5_40060 [Streptomyces sp. RB5]|uniref:DUF1648 domain-containing protein n=1 Tax=Streptomyces smaragdinus TaxID=2585196 RepID=A0A7K0CK28_9ACTN|nr:DUF1648 domain-containing protein [Streptomyces smaragdinus]MQY13850.1 hypothetical protein [Streptomyces smaragdinus]
MTTTRRCTLTAIPFAAATTAYVATFLTYQDRLPTRIATHFTGTGTPDSFTNRTTALWIGTALLLGLGLLLTTLALIAKDGPGARLIAAAGAGTAVAAGYPLVLTVVVNADVRDPAAVHLPLWHVAVLLLAGAATGALAWRLTDSGPRPEPAQHVSALQLADGEVASWSRTMVSRALLIPTALVTLGGLFTVFIGPWQAGVVLLVVGLLCAPLAALRVTVDRRGLTVASTVLPRPRLAVPLGGIVGADSVRVDAMGDFGGWGYRILPNRRGIMLRSGEALAVRTTGGREYVVTVDDSTTGAALLNGLVDRQASGRE